MSEHEPFDLMDPYLVRIREIALALPGAAEKLVVGHPAFYTRKVFAYFGMSRKVDGEWINRPTALSVLLPQDEREAMLQEGRAWIPGYIGPSGWISISLDEETDWDEMAELIEESFRQTAGARLVARLDDR